MTQREHLKCTYCNEPVLNTGFDQDQHEKICPSRPQLEPDAQRERIEQAARELALTYVEDFDISSSKQRYEGLVNRVTNFTLAQVEQALAQQADLIDLTIAYEVRKAADRQAREDDAKVAEEFCQYITRLCDGELEDKCIACRIAQAIRATIKP